jgi:hypothetical protein
MEMSKLLRLRLMAGLVAAGALGACHHTYTAPGVVYVREGPPADRVEVISTSPGEHYIWVGGHWAWRDNNYAWIPGSWVLPTASYSAWVPGHWAHEANGWYWIDGHWR